MTWKLLGEYLITLAMDWRSLEGDLKDWKDSRSAKGAWVGSNGPIYRALSLPYKAHIHKDGQIFNCDMRCIHSLETFCYAGSSITDYPRCSLHFQAQFRIRQWHWQHAASDSVLSFLLSIIANRIAIPLTSVAFYLETLHSALQGDCQWQALALLFHLFGSPALGG